MMTTACNTTMELCNKLMVRFGLKIRGDEERRLWSAVTSLAAERAATPESLAEVALFDPLLQLELAGALTVEESYFFRHPSHMSALRRLLIQRFSVLPPGRSFRVWSAGCSSGEEPYTLAILGRELLPEHKQDQLDILATDIDAEAIRKAVSGIYSQWSLRETSEAALARYFEPTGSKRHLLKGDVRALVRFQHADLLETSRHLPAGSLDLILFRNVSIYLTKGYMSRLYGSFARLLAPGGVLLVSATDVPPSAALFASHPSDDTPGLLVTADSACASDLPGAVRRRKNPNLTQTRPMRVVSPPREESAPRISSLADISLLADRGESERAIALLETRIQTRPNEPEALMLRGQISLALSEARQAQSDFARAVDLSPGNTEARYWLALSYLETGHLSSAHEQLDLILRTKNAPRGDQGNFPSCHREVVKAAITLKEQLS